METRDLDRETEAANLWELIKKEITGIQLLWETMSGLYLDDGSDQWRVIDESAPVFFRLTLSAYMESLLTRISRLMDPARDGKDRENLTLARIATLVPACAPSVTKLRGSWSDSSLVPLRNKYLSHNDLTRIQSEPHALNMLLSGEDIARIRDLVSGLVDLRAAINMQLGLGPSLDAAIRKRAEFERRVLCRTLAGSRLFFELLPESDVLQHAWHEVDTP